MTTIVRSFDGDFAFLSNFAPAVVVFDREEYPTVEHAYQAAKTLHRIDRDRVRIALGPNLAKRHGRSVRLRPDWNDMRVGIIYTLLQQKFQIDNAYGYSLLSTVDAMLIEGNTWHDNFWGEDMRTPGKGLNWLGRLLMQRRAELRGGQ